MSEIGKLYAKCPGCGYLMLQMEIELSRLNLRCPRCRGYTPREAMLLLLHLSRPSPGNEQHDAQTSNSPFGETMTTKPRLTCDIECLPNYFLILFRDVDTGKTLKFSMFNDQYSRPDALSAVEATLSGALIITFNGNSFDLPLIALFIKGAGSLQLKAAANDIISNRLMPWAFERKYGCCVPDHWDHIDLINVAFGTASLKIYMGRLGCQKMQEMPIEHYCFLLPDDRQTIDRYCVNDNEGTAELFFELEGAIELRKTMSDEYGIDLRSKSDAQIAEQVIKSEYLRLRHEKVPKATAKASYKYTPPPFVMFQGKQLNRLLDLCKAVDFDISAKGSVLMPKNEVVCSEIMLPPSVRRVQVDPSLIARIRSGEMTKKELKEEGITPTIEKMIRGKLDSEAQFVYREEGLLSTIPIADKNYKMGIGGLHSDDAPGSHYSDDEYQLLDIDVASYYPNIILNAGFEPAHIGTLFTTIYRAILTRRMKAKREGNKLVADALKIVINGLFGKFGNRYSAVYSPDLMFHTTVTGQLCLLMLIEQFERWGIQVVSANTDGITVKVKRGMLGGQLESIVEWWEQVTGFDMEYAHYASVHYRDVNNYLAVDQESRKVKGKGIFAASGIRKNPAHTIIRDAVFAFVKDGTPPATTIFASADPSAFLEVRKVTGGAVKDGEPLGGTIRWYISSATETAINYAKNGNQVASSERAMPMMDLPLDGRMPADLDYQWYIDKTEGLIEAMGIRQQSG